MRGKNEIPDAGYDRQATDGAPFLCPHCGKRSSYEEIVSQETAERVDMKEMIYRCRTCDKMFRMLN